MRQPLRHEYGLFRNQIARHLVVPLWVNARAPRLLAALAAEEPVCTCTWPKFAPS